MMIHNKKFLLKSGVEAVPIHFGTPDFFLYPGKGTWQGFYGKIQTNWGETREKKW
jgi:hypothetical protein